MYTSRIRGIHTIIHGPTSCAYMMCCNSDLGTIHRDLHGDKQSIWENVSCTDLNDSASVFGGIDSLEKLIRKRVELGDEHIFVISMCVPGIIGDNIIDCCSRMSSELGVTIIPVPVDGIGAGGVIDGRNFVIDKIMEFVEKTDEKDPNLINILGDYRSGREFFTIFDKSVEDLLSAAGFTINTIYPGKCTLDDIKKMGKAMYSVQSTDDYTFNRTYSSICDSIGSIRMKEPLPQGMKATERWLDEVSELTGRNLDPVKAQIRETYDSEIEKIKNRTSGRKVLVVTRPSGNYQWLFELFEDLNVEVMKTRELTYNRWVMGSDLSEGKEPYVSDMISADIDSLSPDLVLSDAPSDIHLKWRCRTIGGPHVGPAGIIDYAKRLGMMFDTPVEEEWRRIS